jgi:hypothetical protein
VHLGDDYRVGHLQGVWIAVTDAARHGQFYPPIFDGQQYRGTRYMPLAIAVNAAASVVIGDPGTAGRIASAMLMTVLLAVFVWTLRRLACPWPLAAGCAGVVVSTDVGLQAATTIGGDLLPVVLQVAALGCMYTREPRVLAAGILAALAVASKMTGVWALLAIGTMLLARGTRRQVTQISAAATGTLVITLGAAFALSRGHLLEHLLAFAFAGVGGWQSMLRSPNQVLYHLVTSAFGAVVLIPLAVAAAAVRPSPDRSSLLYIAAGYALLLLMIVYADIGTGPNQLLDLVVLVALAAGAVPARGGQPVSRRATPFVLVVAAVAVAWALSLDLVRTVAVDVRKTVSGSGDTSHWKSVVVNAIRPDLPDGANVLTEDPSIAIALGQTPVVLDPFMLTRVDRRHPEWVDPLIARITGREFDRVVLIASLDDRSVDYWWTDYHFGRRVTAALRRSYQFERMAGRYFVYRPRPSSVPAAQEPSRP